MSEVERGILGERLDRRNWFIYALQPEGEESRIIDAVAICPDDFPTKDTFWEAFRKKQKELCQKYGWEHVSTGSGGGFLAFVEIWSDELILGGQDQT